MIDLPAFSQPPGNQTRGSFHRFRPGLAGAELCGQDPLLGRRADRPGEKAGGRQNKFAMTGQAPLAVPDAADMGRIKGKGPAQHIVPGGGGLHQKIQLICNEMFHERILSGVCDAQGEHPIL